MPKTRRGAVGGQTKRLSDNTLLIIGNRGGTHISDSFARACRQIEMSCEQIDSIKAMRGPATLRRIVWHFGGHRPLRLHGFSEEVVEFCRTIHPALLLAVGIAPLTAQALADLKNSGCYCVNYLTDDPWNPAHASRWFLQALPAYNHVFTTRRANILDLQNLAVPRTTYLPFGWDPTLFPDLQYEESELRQYDTDVVFVGGGDADRVPYVAALARAGIRVSLYGGYWERFPETRSLARGFLSVAGLQKALVGARIALCLVRRANRDGHCMRTFEIPAAGGCMLAEDTEEHRELLGPNGECVVYFRSRGEMIERAKWLLKNDLERVRLSTAARTRIRSSANTYDDRLKIVLQSAVGQISKAAAAYTG